MRDLSLILFVYLIENNSFGANLFHFFMPQVYCTSSAMNYGVIHTPPRFDQIQKEQDIEDCNRMFHFDDFDYITIFKIQ